MISFFRPSQRARHVAVGLLSLCLAFGCRGTPPAPRYQPYESLLQILADLQMRMSHDIYRFGQPKDIAGQNLYRATLKRLDNYEALYPGAFPDVIAVSRGRAFERLGEYDRAISAYESVGSGGAPELAAVAEQNLGYLRELAATAGRVGDTSNLLRYLADLESKREGLLRMAARFEATPYQALARVEAERADVEWAILAFNNRYVLPGGLEAPLKGMAELIKRHADSHLANRHRVQLADFHFTAAKEYAIVGDPASLDFNDTQFDNLLSVARELYFNVSQRDGAPEKLEARAKLEALEAFGRAVKDERR